MSSFPILRSSSSDADDSNPPCFPVLDLLRKLASAGSLAMKQEKDHMMALVQNSSAGEHLKMHTSSQQQQQQQQEEEEEDEIVFSSENENNSKPSSENVKLVEDDDETLDTSSGSSSSSSTPPSEPTAEISSQDQKVDAEEIPVTQPQHQQQASIMKKTQKTPSVFGLDVVMESEDELDITEVGEEEDTLVAEPPEQLPMRSSAIRWSDEDPAKDPHAVNVTVHEVECIKDRTDMWWQSTEFVTIKQGVSETIRFCKAYNRDQVELLEDILRCDCLEDEDLMKDLLQDLLSTCDSSSSSYSSSESFTRGLEGHLSKMINKQRQRHTRKVLSAQEKLKKENVLAYSDEESCERLREESMDKSQLLAAFARRMGQFDEMVAAKARKARKSLWDI